MEPDLAQFESENKSKINIVNINVDSEMSKLDKFPDVLADMKKVGSIPATYVVDGQGKILENWHGALRKAELDEKSKPYL